MKLVLASSSKQRQDILNMIGFEYEIITSDIEELSDKNDPSKYVMELSLNKANNVKSKLKNKAIIIALDEIIYFNGFKLEKPKTREEAYDNLKKLSGNVNIAYSGLTIIDLYQDKIINTYVTTKIYFKNISEEEINWYLDNEDKIYSCCGYVPLGKGAIFIDKVEGDYNNLFGLSPKVLIDKLYELGYNINDFKLKK